MATARWTDDHVCVLARIMTKLNAEELASITRYINQPADALVAASDDELGHISSKLTTGEMLLLTRHVSHANITYDDTWLNDGSTNVTIDPVVDPASERLSFEPIEYPHLYQHYKEAVGAYWHASEIDLSKDITDWENRLNADERHFIETILAFFAVADGLVMKNLAQNMLQTVTIPEAVHYYAFQNAIESVHAETYSKLIVAYVKDPVRRHQLLNSINDVPIIKKKAAWVQKWIDARVPISRRLAAFAVVEGVFFSSSFCAIFWIKKRGLMPGLTQSNELISRDEGSHMVFAAMMYHMCTVGKFTQQEVHEMFAEAIRIEEEFVRSALPVALIGMNADEMIQYVKYVADFVLNMLDFEPLYNSENPFPWMELISVDIKNNFFENRSSQYQKAGASSDPHALEFTLDADV